MTTTKERDEDSALLRWIDEPSSGRGLSFYQDDGRWLFQSYAELALQARRAAATISTERAYPGGVVALILPTGPEFVAALFGTMLAGDVPCPIAPPVFAQEMSAYRRQTADMLRVACPSLVVTIADLADIASSCLEQAALSRTPVITSLDTATALEDCSPRKPTELGLLQFTSGSSGGPRGTNVTMANLEINVAMIRRWLRIGDTDVTVSWLPLFHDMGLIGTLLTSISAGIDLLVMRPEQFIRSPQTWLDCLGRGPATLTASPTFGFAYAARHVDAARLSGSDFRQWRGALVAAERIDLRVLRNFVSLAGPFGFRAHTFMPAYGLAEATLSVTGGALDELAPAVSIEWSELGLERRVRVRESVTVDDGGTSGDWLVGCGRPHPGVELRIIGEDGKPLPEAHLGEIEIEGPTVAAGYSRSDSGAHTAFARDNVLRSGDAGFLLDGELYVVGRIGDSVKLRGKSIYMEAVESRLARIDGISAGRCVALAGRSSGGDSLVAIVEAAHGPWVAAAAEILERTVAGELEIVILQAERGTIRRTSSGKPRRRVMWRELVEGSLQARCVLRHVPAPIASAGRRRPTAVGSASQ